LMQLSLCVVFVSLICTALAVKSFDDFVLTPNGYRPARCVHGLEKDESIFERNGQVLIISPNRKARALPQCEEGPKNRLPELPNGWAAYTVYSPNFAMSYYGAAWEVPNNPQDAQDQTLFFFSGFQNAYSSAAQVGTTIIQPVLQYGPSAAGGGQYWAIASWYVGAGHSAYSKLAQVNIGDLIVGNMTQSASTSWTITATDSNTGADSSLVANTGVDELFAFVTMEVYDLDSCQDYPSGSVNFYDLVIENASGDVETPTWQPETEPGCEESVKVNSPSSVSVFF